MIESVMESLADLWIGCGCLFMAGLVVFGLVLAAGQGGSVGALPLLALLGLVAYMVRTRRAR